MQQELLINPDEVEDTFKDCLYRDKEMVNLDDGGIPEGAVMVEGIMRTFGFHPKRLEANRARVSLWLEALPSEFQASGGGGYSFLNACNQENGVQWTGMHFRMDQLFALGMGLGLVRSLLPRTMWPALPGSMPYYVIQDRPSVEH